MILKSKGREISTTELIESMDQFPELCKGCKSGTYLIRTGMKLMKKGIIERTAKKGGFYWRIKK